MCIRDSVYTGAIASQKKDYRFKIGTIGEKKPEDWIVVEGQHEPLIDRMSFDIVQNKLKSRQRPGQTNEISLFAGLIKCGECGKSLTVRYTNAKHPQQIYKWNFPAIKSPRTRRTRRRARFKFERASALSSSPKDNRSPAAPMEPPGFGLAIALSIASPARRFPRRPRRARGG